MKIAGSVLIFVSILIAISGCVTGEDPALAAKRREDFRALEAKATRAQGSVETLTLEYNRLLNQIKTLQAQLSTSTGREKSFQAQLDDMARKIQALEKNRLKDRQAIINQLSSKMAKLIKAAAKRAQTSTTIVAIGNEHVVKEGETLSVIAAAYNVKMSAIIKANNLDDPDSIREGLKLIIPK